MEITGLSRSSIYSRIELATFPKQKKLGPRTVAWLESEIDEWLDSIGCLQRMHKPATPKASPEQITTTPITPEPANFSFTMSDTGVLTITAQNASGRKNNKSQQ